MLSFFKLFLDIVLWRRGPQDLPASPTLVVLALVAYVAVSAVQLLLMGESGRTLWLYLVGDPLLMMGWVWLVLAVFGKRERYLQTVAAVLGAATILSLLLALPLQLVGGLGDGAGSSGSALLTLLLLAAFVAVIARIIRIATETSAFASVALTIAYVLFLDGIAAFARSAGT
jgi:hypothetical protein